ncbi:MAG: response regulator transcription factor [Candidatus Izimaplasma sp.]|nr:response regulator transcription factor [Candidatus Izimaplasma bacterium]
MNKRILIIEDEPTINDVLNEYLVESGFTCVQAYDGLDGLMKFNESISLVICDVMMPKLDGFSVVKEIRKQSDVSIIMLTALNSEEDVLKGYDLGVDEFVSKPFSPKIIVRKVEAILNRNVVNLQSELIIKGGIEMDTITFNVRINHVAIKLSKKEFELLKLFLDNENIVFTRDSLLNHIWGHDYFGDDRVVDTAIKRLRKRLLEASVYIKTIHGIGYKFEVKQ